jgi:hypothetical protein
MIEALVFLFVGFFFDRSDADMEYWVVFWLLFAISIIKDFKEIRKSI